MKFFCRLFPILLSKSPERLRENHTCFLLLLLGFFYAAQQFMNYDRMGLSFQLEPSRLPGQKSIDAGHHLFRYQDLGSQVLIDTVHSCCRIYGIAGRSIPIMLPGTDIAEKNLSGMNAYADGKF